MRPVYERASPFRVARTRPSLALYVRIGGQKRARMIGCILFNMLMPSACVRGVLLAMTYCLIRDTVIGIEPVSPFVYVRVSVPCVTEPWYATVGFPTAEKESDAG